MYAMDLVYASLSRAYALYAVLRTVMGCTLYCVRSELCRSA